MQEDSTATSDSVISCNLPFFTQELLLVDSKVLKTRVRKYNQNNVDEGSQGLEGFLEVFVKQLLDEVPGKKLRDILPLIFDEIW